MAFKVAARTVLELGAELISSDQIALYELIKNAYDAGSKRAIIDIASVFKFSSLRNLLRRLDAMAENPDARHMTVEQRLEPFHEEIRRSFVDTASVEDRTRFTDILGRPSSVGDFAARLQLAFDEVNRIDVIDRGEGMSLDQLDDIFLTIGTHSRLRSSADGRTYVGGKGIGRLSAMRLGDRLEVTTGTVGESRWNVLDIDWTIFDRDVEEALQGIPVNAVQGAGKELDRHGTTIRIRSLKADWDADRVRRMADTYFDRLFDPFGDVRRYPLAIFVNRIRVPIRTFDRAVYAEAQGHADIRYDPHGSDGPQLVIDMEFTRYGRRQTKVLDRTDLLGLTSAVDISVASFESLGPFTASFRWFNRQRIKAIDGWGDRERARSVVNNWANGLLLYRDGFRVNPYGNPEDDWLGIDAKALSSAGYKLNRKQLLGAVRITARGNPHLIDQTNREGLRSTEEKQLLVLLMQKAITDEFKVFVNAVEKEAKKATRIDVAETGAFLQSVSGRLKRTLKEVQASVPAQRREDVRFLQETYQQLEDRLDTARSALQTAERDYKELVHLAGVGLQVEIVAHELGRVSRRTLETIETMDRSSLPKAANASLDVMESQMLVIRRRLDILNPLGPSSRNRRKRTDLRELIRNILDSHADQFARHGVASGLTLRPDDQVGSSVEVVPGMIVQILENLIDNSVFWLRQKRRNEPLFKPSIRIVVDGDLSQIRVTDNGPGIPAERSQSIFEPFVTSKPPGEGKGLGLYISREIARYHSCELYLSDEPDAHGRLHTFVIDIDGL